MILCGCCQGIHSCAGEVERLVGFLFVCSLLSDIFIKQTITASAADISNLIRNNNISEEIVLKRQVSHLKCTTIQWIELLIADIEEFQFLVFESAWRIKIKKIVRQV